MDDEMPLGETAAADEHPKARILVVDDDQIFAAAAGLSLAGAGYDVQVAESFQVALDALEAPRPLDLMLTDLVMPHQVNGIALSRMARMRRKDLKIIFVTGYEIPPGADAQAVGPILRKPVTEELMLAEIARILGDR